MPMQDTFKVCAVRTAASNLETVEHEANNRVELTVCDAQTVYFLPPSGLPTLALLAYLTMRLRN